MLSRVEDPKFIVPHHQAVEKMWNVNFWVNDADALYEELKGVAPRLILSCVTSRTDAESLGFSTWMATTLRLVKISMRVLAKMNDFSRLPSWRCSRRCAATRPPAADLYRYAAKNLNCIT